MDWLNRTRRIAGVLVLGLLALAASGCGGGTTITPPPPPPTLTLTGISPYLAAEAANNWVPAGIPGFTLLASGTGFTTTSVIEWNGTALPTAFGTSTDINAPITAAMVAAPGTANVMVYDPATGAKSATLTFGIASPAAATAGVVQMITVAPGGTPANGDSLVAPSISTTGRYVSFQSAGTNLGAGTAGTWAQIYERDTCIGAPSGCTPTTIPITVTADGSAPNGNSRTSSVSGDGRYVAYDTQASNILSTVPSCWTEAVCVFLRDTCIGVPSGCTPSTTLITTDTLDGDGNPEGGNNPFISPDGRYITFNSALEAASSNESPQTLMRDTCNGAPAGCTPSTILISQSTTGVVGNESSYRQAVNSGGRFVVFSSYSTNLIPNDTSIWSDVFLRDTCTGAPAGCVPSTSRVSTATDGTQGNGGVDFNLPPSISSDGRFVAFSTDATNLVANDPYAGIMLRDTCFGAPAGCTPTTSLVSIGNDGSIPNWGDNEQSMSADGRFIAFASLASNLVPGDTFAASSWEDIFVHDTCIGAPAGCTPSTVRVSVANYAQNFATQSNAINDYPQISGDGHYVVFLSSSTNYLASGGDGNEMVYLAKTGY
jgi:trimeric autotransporter adhesin